MFPFIFLKKRSANHKNAISIKGGPGRKGRLRKL